MNFEIPYDITTKRFNYSIVITFVASRDPQPWNLFFEISKFSADQEHLGFKYNPWTWKSYMFYELFSSLDNFRDAIWVTSGMHGPKLVGTGPSASVLGLGPNRTRTSKILIPRTGPENFKKSVDPCYITGFVICWVKKTLCLFKVYFLYLERSNFVKSKFKLFV